MSGLEKTNEEKHTKSVEDLRPQLPETVIQQQPLTLFPLLLADSRATTSHLIISSRATQQCI